MMDREILIFFNYKSARSL